MGNEEVGGKQRSLDDVPEGSEDAVTGSGGEGWEVAGIAASGEVMGGPSFGLRVGSDDGPARIAVALVVVVRRPYLKIGVCVVWSG